MTFTPGKSFENWMSVAGGGGGVFGKFELCLGGVGHFKWKCQVFPI